MKKIVKKNIGPRVQQRTVEFYGELFRSTNNGAEYVLESFVPLYRGTLLEVKGAFLELELSIILDLVAGTSLVPELAGQELQSESAEAILLDSLDTKMNIDGDIFLEKIQKLTSFQRFALSIWAKAFWASPNKRENYIKKLS